MTISFTGGEIAPQLYGRVDLAKYQNSLKTCRNFKVKGYGGVENRPGTQYIATTKTTGDRVRLVPFVFNQEQSYVLELGDNYARVYKEGAAVWSTIPVSKEAFGTGDGEAKTFTVKDDGSAVIPTAVTAVYVDGTVFPAEPSTSLLGDEGNDFSLWTASSATVTSNNATAPDTTLTADTLNWSV